MRMASEFPAAAPVGFLVIVSLCSVAASLLPVGVLHGDLAVLEREHVAALDLDANAVVPGAGKHPFGHAPVPRDEVSRPAPCGVRELLEYRLDPFPDLALTVVDGAPHADAGRGFEHAVFRYRRHDRIHVVTVPGVGESVKERKRDLVGPGFLRHPHSLHVRASIAAARSDRPY